MTKLSRIHAEHRDAGALHELVNLFGFVDSRTFLTKSGDVGVVIQVRGIDYECLDPNELNRVARRFEATLKVFDERFRVYQYLLKRDDPSIPHRNYPDNPVLQQAVAARIDHLKAKAHRLYSLETYFVVLYQRRQSAHGMIDALSKAANRPLASLREGFGAERRQVCVRESNVGAGFGELRAGRWARVPVERAQREILAREFGKRLPEAGLEHAIERQRVEDHDPLVVRVVDLDPLHGATRAELRERQRSDR